MAHSTSPSFPNADSGDCQADSGSHTSAPMQAIADFKEAVDTDLGRLDAELSVLRDRSMLLVGALITINLLLSAAFGWLIVKVQRLESAAQPESALVSRVEQLEQQMQTLDQRVSSDLVGQVKATQQRLTGLQGQLQSIEETVLNSLASPPNAPAAAEPSGSPQGDAPQAEDSPVIEDAPAESEANPPPRTPE